MTNTSIFYRTFEHPDGYSLIRFPVGVEAIEDLLADLERAITG
jgi:cystathionine beta-lyase/cystathionine gamma-synthase